MMDTRSPVLPSGRVGMPFAEGLWLPAIRLDPAASPAVRVAIKARRDRRDPETGLREGGSLNVCMAGIVLYNMIVID